MTKGKARRNARSSADRKSPTADRAPDSLDRPSGLFRPLPACAAIVLAGLAAYSNSFHGPFIFDDGYFVNTQSAMKLWPIWPTLAGSRPVVQASLALNYTLGGPGVTGYHVFNLIVHLLAALALFGIVRRTLTLPALAGRFSERIAAALGFCVALLWAVHPLQTEAVTYVIQRMESLMALFYLLTLYGVVRAATSQRPRAWHAAAVAACALGMGCKEVMVSAPVVVLLYDRCFIAGSFREALRRRWGLYVGLAATWVILVRSVLEAFGPHAAAAGAGFAIQSVTPRLYAQSQFGVILHYLRLAFWPTGLCLDYFWPVARGAREIAPGAAVVGILLAATLWALARRPAFAKAPAGKPATRTAGKPATESAGKLATETAWTRAWGFAGAFFFLVLAPTSSIMPIQDLAFEHRMYLPLAAVLAAAVVAAFLLARRLGLGAGALLVLCAAAAVALGMATHRRNADYRTALSIYEDTVAKRPENPRAWQGLGWEKNLAGDYEGALQCLDRALKLPGDEANARSDRGVVCQNLHRYAEALSDFNRAIVLKPNFADAYDNRANLYLATGRFQLAVDDCDCAIALEPDSPRPYNNRGLALDSTGRYEEALRDYGRALALNPNLYEAWFNRALALGALGRDELAIGDYSRSIALKPQFAEGYRARALIYAKLKRPAEALKDFDRAVALRPDSPDALYSRALFYFQIKEYVKARADMEACDKLHGSVAPEFRRAVTQATAPTQ
ncbi:MAG: tetratricopeptide repeat protein [Candidatus Brocadiia bacterium]